MALVGFVDDSGSEPSSSHFVLAGYVNRVENWIAFADEWAAVLASGGRIDYLKASEVWNQEKGQFLGFSDEERREKVEGLVGLIEKSNSLALSVSVNWREYEEFAKGVPLHHSARDPYFFLFYALIARMLTLNLEFSMFEPVDFVFDNHNKVGRRVQRWYPVLQERAAPNVRAILGEEPIFRDEKSFIPLQAADLLAWYARREATGVPFRDQWHRHTWERLKKFAFTSSLGHQELWHIANDFNVIKEGA